MITIATYDPAWPAAFDAEAAILRRTLGPTALRVEHVGSTAVPGLAAKAVIDIQVSVASLADRHLLDPALSDVGYKFHSLGEFDRVYPFFAKPDRWPETHHVHLCQIGGEQEARHLAFRDVLRKDASLAEAYATLKRTLALRFAGTTLESRERYSLSKSHFIEQALLKSGFKWPGPGAA